MVSGGAVKLVITISKLVEKERIPNYSRRDNLVALPYLMYIQQCSDRYVRSGERFPSIKAISPAVSVHVIEVGSIQ